MAETTGMPGSTTASPKGCDVTRTFGEIALIHCRPCSRSLSIAQGSGGVPFATPPSPWLKRRGGLKAPGLPYPGGSVRQVAASLALHPHILAMSTAGTLLTCADGSPQAGAASAGLLRERGGVGTTLWLVGRPLPPPLRETSGMAHSRPVAAILPMRPIVDFSTSFCRHDSSISSRPFCHRSQGCVLAPSPGPKSWTSLTVFS